MTDNQLKDSRDTFEPMEGEEFKNLIAESTLYDRSNTIDPIKSNGRDEFGNDAAVSEVMIDYPMNDKKIADEQYWLDNILVNKNGMV